MAAPKRKSGTELFIVDNNDSDWKVRSYISDWCELSKAIDIATGYFEIGGLLCLKEKWQQVDRIRILMGDEVSYRTKAAFTKGLQRIQSTLDRSLEDEKLRNDFLEGVPAIVEGIRSGKIVCRVFRKDKFHAKAYITHGRAAVIGSFALVGSSNFTFPGLNDNIELNVQITGSDVSSLQDWFEQHWNEADDVTADILRTFERHTNPHQPFEIWLKSLYEYFYGRELDADNWDREKSVMYKILDKYQRDAYKNLMQIASRFGGAFLCDGVGLGKTYVGLMLLERLVFKEKKQVVLFAPKAAREDVWNTALEQYMPKAKSEFVNLVVYNHTDLNRVGDWPEKMALTVRDADVILIDEAHHFRNKGVAGEQKSAPSRYRKLQDYIHSGDRPKQIYFLTATPINNTVHDFRNMIELFTKDNEQYFSTTIGIHNLTAHFIQLNARILGKTAKTVQLALNLENNLFDAERVLHSDKIFDALVVQRSRAYVKESQLQSEGGVSMFPEREIPKVVPYNLKSTYGILLKSVEQAFRNDIPLFNLSVYYPLKHWIGGEIVGLERAFADGRQKMVVSLIRTSFLKRFESSAVAFEISCWRLLKNLLKWITVHGTSENSKRSIHSWKLINAPLINYQVQHELDLYPTDTEEDEVEDFLSDESLAEVIQLDDPENYDIDKIVEETLVDLSQLAAFLQEVRQVKPERDDKLKSLIKLLKTDPVLKKEKAIIFTEFADTARYLEHELKNEKIKGIYRVDGSFKHEQRSEILHRFSPYYNGRSSVDLAASGQSEIRILISTDVLSEGLNLQDATRLINYDLHWNPVRLMQRIGRVDRRMNPEIEAKIVEDHPELKATRGKVAFWNFLPPDELNLLLGLFQKVSKKVLVISKLLGIEGRKLLTPDDEFDPIRELNEQCDGELSEAERLRLEYEKLMRDYPELAAELPDFPNKVYSGREAQHSAKAIFFCYRIPGPDPDQIDTETGMRWTERMGKTVWYCCDLASGNVTADLTEIARIIRTAPDTSRRIALDRTQVTEIRKKVERQVIHDELRTVQSPIGVSPILKCWMELN